MIRFECDYTEGMHPRILERIVETNMEQAIAYSEDTFCEKARAYIKRECRQEDADVHFLVGGTQTNLTVISSILRPHQGVLCADSGHINVHETGAIEATGHKVLPLFSADGKITAKQIQEAYDSHWADSTSEHMVQPGMVYISHPTENGTIYSKEELTAIYEVCCTCELPLFIDGARLGYALAAKNNDLSLADIACLCDVFYIGGTKVGAMFGEAVVILNSALKKDFRYLIKQRGGMLAKGRYLGLQFETLFQDGLYYDVSEHAVSLAMRIREACERQGYDCLYDSWTNQQFPILPNQLIERLQEKYAFFIWKSVDEERSAVRFCTSWATESKTVEMLIKDLEN